ncbi:cysteine-rich protein 2-binding protein-like [Dendronephthya gigantea]|uniref:cysteine-rich protein 2-binding protein-like n=1 Tax=Dendronephthya gigantea TaxID=151771 RepID=UPI00106CA32C|nr:cysteine-rich protein 2-binding protein-like [Dendronephthya gigantea]
MAFDGNKADVSSVDGKSSSERQSKDAVVCYCAKNITPSMLTCLKCQKLFHSTCLKNGRPSNFKGDVFFEFTCANCSNVGKEECKRKAMNWLQVVYLSLYNLICRGSGRKGYFRWRDDLCQFIEQNWNIFHVDKKKTSSWCSTVAGTLSTNCPKIFKSGQKEFKEGGWWTLQEVLPPSEKPEVMTPGLNPRRRKKGGNTRTGEVKANIKKRRVEKANDEILENGMLEKNHKAGKLSENVKISESEKERGTQGNRVNSVSESSDITEQINTFLESNGDISELDIGDIGAMDEILDSFENTSDESLLSSFTQANENAEAKFADVEKTTNGEEEEESVIVLDPKELNTNQPSTSKMEINSDSEGDDSDEEVASQAKNLRTMEPQEERLLLEKLNKIDSSNPTARRLRRKLIINHRKRQCGLPVFDLDKVMRTSIESVSHYVLREGKCTPVLKPSFQNQEQELVVTKPRKTSPVKHERVLDRFMMQPVSQKPVKQVSFLGRLIGCNPRSVNRAITSPYTSRILKPFIRRDFEATPLKLKLLREICTWFRKRFPDHELPPVEFGSIDYCYVQPHHIPGVNALCREFFWPGIDLSECLQYPDFTCVVLYKKLIIGCAFMVPDVKYNEAYISFVLVHPDWRRAGIGSFMIYHLIQTCLGKDVTLHVSANNPAMLLYQKFGFKPERFVVGFYDRYYPSEGLDSKHAFFLRLQR